MAKAAKKDGLLGRPYTGVAVPPNKTTGGGLIGRWADRMRNARARFSSKGDSYSNTSEYRRMNGAQQKQFNTLSPEAQARVISKGRAFQSTMVNGEGYGTYIGRALNDARNRENSRSSRSTKTTTSVPTAGRKGTSNKSAGQYRQPMDSSVVEEALSNAAQTRRTRATSRVQATTPSSAKKGTIGGLKNTPAAGQQKATTYTIKKGDTLGTIAKRYGVDWRALAEANGIDDPNLVYAGVKLKIDPATMGKKNRRKVGVNNPKAPGMHLGEKKFPTPTREEALGNVTNMPISTGALSIEVPEEY